MPATHRELKKERTRDELAAHAARLFRRHGFDGVTVDSIAMAAGVSRRTFFRYFPSKESVVFPNHARRLRAFRAALTAAGEDAAGLAQVRIACRQIAAQLGDARDELVAQRRLIDRSPALIAKERELDAQWEEAIAAVFAPDAGARQARILASIVMGAVRGALLAWFEGGAASDLAAIGDEALDLLANGLRDGSSGAHRAAGERARASSRKPRAAAAG